jgi:mycothiol synthase
MDGKVWIAPGAIKDAGSLEEIMNANLQVGNTLLDPDLRLRPAHWSDAKAVARLTHDARAAEGDAALALSPEEVIHGWRAYDYDLDRDAFVVETSDGRIVGYDNLTNSYEYASYSMDGYTHPEFKKRGIGTTLLRAVERRVREMMRFAEPDVRVSIQATIGRDKPDGVTLHEKEGYRPNQYHWRMEVVLSDPPAEPEWPEGIELRPFIQSRHDAAVWHANNEAWRDEPGSHEWSLEKWRQYRFEDPEFDPELWVIAWAGEEVVGYSINRYRAGIGWIRAIGVRPQSRKRGIGKALLLHSFGKYYRRGTHTIGLRVDSQSSIGAQRLYQKVGMHTAGVSVTYKKVLRAGHDPEAV